MDHFCGSSFWNSTLTWYTDNPDFTECFHQTVLVWTPCALLWTLLPYELYQILRNKTGSIPWSILNIHKLIINSMLILLSIAFIGYYGYQSINEGKDIADVYFVTPSVLIATFTLSLVLTLAEMNRGIHSSASLFLFWSLLTFCGVFTYRTRIQSTTDGMSEEEQFPFVWSMIYFPLVFAMLFLHLFSDTPTQCESQSPEESASFASRLIYHWFDGLVWKGYKKPLEQPDLSDLNREDKSQNLVPKFNADWEKSKNRHEISVQQLECNGTDLDNSKNHQIPTKKIVSVLPALIRSFGPAFFFGGTLKAVQDCLGFVGPQILSLLIALVKNPEEETWKGYLYAVVLTVTAIAQTIFMNHYMQYMNSVGLKVRTVIVASVYRKALRISNSARKESTVGEIVNLMAVDAQRLLDITVYLNLIWSAPFQIMLAIYFLYQIIGVAVFAGLAVMIILIPINGILANANKKLQVEQMKNKDKRVKMMNEILSGIKVLKLYAWESSFQENVEEIRKKEVKVLKQSAYYSAGSTFIWTCAPFLVSLASFMTFVLESPENELTPDIAFVALTLFNIMRTPMTNIPLLITQFVQAKVSLKRLNKFLNADELDIESIIHQPTANPIVVENGSFSWAESDPPTLKNIDLNIQPAKLVAVVGQVGAGKTSLISALMAEMVKVEGKVITNGRIAYVPQQAWIQNCSLRNNILFGNNYEASKYKDVIAACDLTTDLMILPGGDSTEIGEKGINLSGGQKQRVSVARAVYADLDIYLFDDPLSAVDSHVGKHIFDKVIGPNGLLKHKTRLLVTHSIAFLPQVDQIIVLRDGYITEIGSYEELLSQKGAFSELLLSYSDDTNSGDDYGLVSEIGNDSTGVDESQAKLNRKRSQMSNISFTSESFCSRNGSIVSAKSLKPADMTTRNQLIEKERSEIGKVKGDVYLYYFRSVGGWLSFFTLLLYVAYQAFCMYGNIWLSKWSATNVTTSSERDLYLGVYGALGAGQAISSLTATVCLALGTINASNYLHAQMLERIMRSPMSYFDTTPLGRIINRFAKDVDTVDNMLPPTIRSAITNFLSALATIIIIANGTPIFLAVAIPIGFFYYWLRNVYVATSRQLKRLESISRSPIYSHFSETLTGASVIRAYGHQQRFISESDNRVDMNQNCYYHGIIAVRWLSVRLESMGNLVVFFAAMFAVIARESLDPGLVGLSISYSLSITQNLNWFLRMTADLETNIVSVERIKDYTQISQEASWETGKVVPVKQWPTEGQIVFDNYQVRYRDDLDLVLKGISCQIKGGEKVGIVGRTGAGKSSLTLGLFRILEAAAGAITIDGINISDLGLHTLRSRLTIIPQDPVLFSGSLRMNIDPFNSYSDQAIWTALEHAHLKAFVQSLPTVLHYQVSEGGENLSVGQRQLICLARALLRKTQVLVLDEATAAVDLETDDLIQATIRKEFKECTVLTIAHRLKTIMDSNRVMVLGQGEIKEFAPPSELLADKKSIFYGMAKDAGLV